MSVETDPQPASRSESSAAPSTPPAAPPVAPSADASRVTALVRRHLAIGWWGLLVFLTLGIVIEALHGFKVRWYSDVGMELRQAMMRLTHAHGGMLAIVHLLFAGTLTWMPHLPPRSMTVASRCLTIALLLIPGGFCLGGFFLLRTESGVEAEPGVGVFLVPIGAVFLVVGIVSTALAQRSIGRD
ncbi:MAG: hypothetical protein WD066_00425 [Planctomycetaceae bacterium]